MKLHHAKSFFDIKTAMAWVARSTGKSAFRQGCEMLGLLVGSQRITPEEYYLYGLWRREISAPLRRSYVSDIGSTRLNSQLSPPSELNLRGLLGNKQLLGLTLRAAGFPVLDPLALFGDTVFQPGVPVLRDASQIAAWLARDGNLPCFGKPIVSSLGKGAASFLALSDDRSAVHLGNGATVALTTIAAEIVANYAAGYVFQPLIRQHPDVEAVTGRTVGGLRVVTLRTSTGAALLYVVQRLPAKGAMIDAANPSGPTAVMLIDDQTGRVLRAQNLFQMVISPLDASLVTGKPFADVTLPFVPQAIAMAIDVHRMLRQPGVLGFDIALSVDGPVINEVNANPYHLLYQRAAGQGLLNADFQPLISEATAIAAADSKPARRAFASTRTRR